MSKTVPYPLPVAGVDVLSSETALVKGAVRSAVNVDITRTGHFARRAGQTPLIAASNLHSLHYSVMKGYSVIAQDKVLNKLDPVTYGLTNIFTLNSAARLAYTEYNGALYFTNKETIGWITPEGQARSVGVPVPQPPTLSATLGTLTPGKYGVVLTLVDDRGEQSGPSTVQTIELPTGGGIRLSNLTQKNGYQIWAYITAPDGDQLRLTESFPAVFPAYSLTEQANGSIMDNYGCVPMPPGDFICWHNGRLVTAHQNVVKFSRPLYPGLHDPAHDYWLGVGYISFIASVGEGLYVGDSRGVWYLAGKDPTKFEQTLVSTCRAVKHSVTMVPPEHFDPKVISSPVPVAVWLSTSGYVVGIPGGSAVELHANRIKVPTGLSGRSAFLLRNGRKQIVTTVNSTSTTVPGSAVDSVLYVL